MPVSGQVSPTVLPQPENVGMQILPSLIQLATRTKELELRERERQDRLATEQRKIALARDDQKEKERAAQVSEEQAETATDVVETAEKSDDQLDIVKLLTKTEKDVPGTLSATENLSGLDEIAKTAGFGTGYFTGLSQARGKSKAKEIPEAERFAWLAAFKERGFNEDHVRWLNQQGVDVQKLGLSFRSQESLEGHRAATLDETIREHDVQKEIATKDIGLKKNQVKIQKGQLFLAQEKFDNMSSYEVARLEQNTDQFLATLNQKKDELAIRLEQSQIDRRLKVDIANQQAKLAEDQQKIQLMLGETGVQRLDRTMATIYVKTLMDHDELYIDTLMRTDLDEKERAVEIDKIVRQRSLTQEKLDAVLERHQILNFAGRDGLLNEYLNTIRIGVK